MSGVPRPLLHIPYVYIMICTFTLPTVSLLTIASLGVYLHFDETTGTHCKVAYLGVSVGILNLPNTSQLANEIFRWGRTHAGSRIYIENSVWEEERGALRE